MTCTALAVHRLSDRATAYHFDWIICVWKVVDSQKSGGPGPLAPTPVPTGLTACIRWGLVCPVVVKFPPLACAQITNWSWNASKNGSIQWSVWQECLSTRWWLSRRLHIDRQCKTYTHNSSGRRYFRLNRDYPGARYFLLGLELQTVDVRTFPRQGDS